MKRRLVRAQACGRPDKRREAFALAALAFSGAAQAITLGEAEVRSALGQPLEARIPVTAASGENLRGACFSLASRGTANAPALTEAELTLRRSARGNFLEVRSHKPVQDPSVTFSVAVACPGASQPLARDFTLLIDKPVSARPPTVAPATVAFGARQGDTLQSIARAIVPDNAAARADYLRALREANPQLAARGEDAAIGAQEKIALPDLRTYARSSRRTRSATAEASSAPRSTQASAPPRAASSAAQVQAPAPHAQAVESTAPATAAAAERPARKPRQASAPASSSSRPAPGSPFQLKLSAPEVDLTASRNIGERERAQLRERLAMLDADDQVAAMLSLRHSLKQLEARVAELQLKLSTMPQSLEQRPAGSDARPAAAPVAPAVQPPPAPPPTAAVPVAPPAATTAPAPVSPAPTAKPEIPARPETPKPEVTAKPESVARPEAAAKGEATQPSQTPATSAAAPRVEPVIAPPPRASKPRLSVADADGNDGRAWWWALAAAIAILGLLWSFLRWRRKRLAGDAWLDEPEIAPPPLDEIAPPSVPTPVPALEAQVATTDENLPTRLATNDAAELRRRYMEERFPELGTGMIDLEQAASVIKAARLLYEDGAAPRAIELLQFALETHPAEIRHWLALFEIYRLERLTGEFGALALRFQQRFGDTEHWDKVRYFGREIDPSNPLFKEPLDGLQTIGPRESRRLAAAASFDPLAENWLNAPMDFENEVLANELRNALMQKAGMKEEDLQPNPTSALRHVEMFTVA